MITYNKETPILLLAQGRIETVRQIYNMLRQIEPKRLYLYYDAPESENEKKSHEQIRALFEKPEWRCRIKSFTSKKRPGESVAMMQAARRFFRYETEGIVLNGNSVPFPAFFAFCSCLLEKYRYDERIGHISGRDFLKTGHKSTTNDTYYFSKLVHTNEGWASWRRVWKDMEAQLKMFNAFKKQNIIDEIPTHKPFQFMWFLFDRLSENPDGKYEYINLINNRLSVVPYTYRPSFSKYELPEMRHPVFMVNRFADEMDYQELTYRTPAVTTNKPDGMTFMQKKLSSFQTEKGRCMHIPRIIHQIYEDPAGPPDNLLRMAESWKKKMPDWEYRFWNKPMIQDFLTSTCPDFMTCYHSYPFDVQRWDAIRYLILYHIGGLYVDMDYECFQPLDVLLAGSTCCMGMEPTINGKIFNRPFVTGNALMAAKPKHPYMAAIIDDLKASHSVDYHRSDSIQIMETTGPFMVTKVYERLKRKKDVTLLSADLVAPLTINEVLILRTGQIHPDILQKMNNAYAVHYFFGSWTAQTTERT